MSAVGKQQASEQIMLSKSTNVIYIFMTLLISLLISLFFSYVSILISRSVNLIDEPGSEPHKQHRRPVPIAGGVALFATLIISGLFSGTFQNQDVRAAFIAAIPLFIFGLWDDFKNISPVLKLTGQLIAGVVLISQGIYIKIFESPEFFFHGSGGVFLLMNWLVTILWVVGITNAFNFVDSMDGLAIGLGSTAASFFLLVTMDSGQVLLSQFCAMVLGAGIGLYFFNAPPAALFLGDSGSQMLGFLLAVVGISYAPIGVNQASSWFVPILLLSVPIFDAALVIISRLKRHKPIYQAALDHTYHRLLRYGLESNRAVLLMHVISLTLSCFAFVSLAQPPLISNVIFMLIMISGGLTLLLLDQRTDWL
jgi:UDP-GlcNAc:undecaprenyl-phosphate/decaprenyl-phosphate GlcNAc-1-phosphate transferase